MQQVVYRLPPVPNHMLVIRKHRPVSARNPRHCGEVVETTSKKVREYLNMVVDEVRWSNRLNHYNHSPCDPLQRLYAH